ncbi:hypothetical protein Tco_0284065, partial [Tanacetum coccineum]
IPEPATLSTIHQRVSDLEKKVKILRNVDHKSVILMGFLALGLLLEEAHMTWAHLEKKRTRLQTYTKSLEDFCKQWLETATSIKRCHRDLYSDGVRNLATASGRG